MGEGFRVLENRITATNVTVNINNNNNIISGGQATINNNNNNGDQSTNNNTNNIKTASPAKNKRKFDELEDQERSKTMPSSSNNEGISVQTDLAARTCHGTRGVKLLTTELVGQAFKTKNDEIWSLLLKDEVTSIGVWGMGGVGKTTLMTNINNQLLESEDIFSYVYWVTLSHDVETDKLQDCIAKEIEFDLSKEDDMKKRAAKLYDELISRQNFVLILDNLWEHFDAKEIGIPIGVNRGCKMVFTTRSWDVCRRMCICNENIIKLEPLSEEEAWTLFTMELGDYNSDLEPLAKAVARECAGLPLGLKTMSRSMRGVDDMSEWRDALEELKEAEKRVDDMETKVFRILRYSYDRLKDLVTQECFLYCAFFPEDFEIQREELIEYLIVEGIIQGKKSRQAKHDKGHVILNKLENACLLERCTNRNKNRYVKMHDLIRDMAIQKLREKSSILVKSGAQLREIPDLDEWTDNLERVSLMGNYIKEILSDHSPRCPKLSSLLLGYSWRLRLIANSFLEQLHGLKVLDLSNSSIVKLPNSISELVSLVALLLRQCTNLTYIPSLAKLKELQKLDLSRTGLEKLPEGMELVSNLRYLNLWGSKIKEIPTGILPNLSHLQILILNKFYHFNEARISVTGKEVACLRKLESLECYFEGFSDFRECMEHLSLCTYNIQIGAVFEGSLGYHFSINRSAYLSGCCISTEQDFKAFPEDIEELLMKNCKFPGISLFGDSSLSLRCSTKLKFIHLKNCDGIKSLVSCTSSNILRSLESLKLFHLNNFLGVISRLPSLQSVGLFSCLRHFQIDRCHGVKSLFPIGLLSTLQNLESLVVGFCDRMEEIQATEEDEEEEDDDQEERRKGEQNNSSSHNLSVEFRLPKLKQLGLFDLPNLKSICSGEMICDSLQYIEIDECPKLKRIPLSYPLPCLESIYAGSKEWWDSVEWDQLSDKNLLQPPILNFSTIP